MESTVQWVAAGVGLWGLLRRRPFGRWLATGFAAYLALMCAFGVAAAADVMHGDVNRYWFGGPQVRHEALGVSVIVLALGVAFTILGFRLALAADVREYFRGRRVDEEAARE